MHELKAGSVDQTIRFMLTKSDSTPYTGLVHSTPGLKCYYSRQGAASIEIPLVDILVIGTHVSGGFKSVDGTNMPGYYELGIPNAAIAAGTKFVDIMISGPADLYVCPQRVRLTGIDLDDATNAGLSKIAQLEFDGDNNICSVPMSMSVDVNNMIANTVWLYGTLDELDENTAGGRLFKAQMGLDAYYDYVFDSYGYLKATMWEVESNARVNLAAEIWGNCDISSYDANGVNYPGARLKAILDKTTNLPASPAAVGSPMTLADGAITAAKVVDGALTSAKVPSIGSVVGNIGGSVNNISSGVDLSAAALAAVWTHGTRELTAPVEINQAALDASIDSALSPITDDITAISTLVTRMMGPGNVLKEFPVFSGAEGSTIPLPGVTVWVTTDGEGSIIYAGPQVSAEVTGMTRWMITEGVTFYFWCQMPGRTFQNPTEVHI